MVFEKHQVGTEEIKTTSKCLTAPCPQVTLLGHPFSHTYCSSWHVISFLSHNSSWKPLPEPQSFCSSFSFQPKFTLDHFVCTGSVPVLSFILDRSPFPRLLLADASPVGYPLLGWKARRLAPIFLTFPLTSLSLFQLEGISLKCGWPGLYAVFHMVSPGPRTKTWMLPYFYWKYLPCCPCSYLFKKRNWVSLARCTFSKPMLHFIPYCFYLCIIN